MNVNVKLLDTNVKDLGLSSRTVNSLQDANIFNLRDLLDNDYSRIKGLGYKSKIEIEELKKLITKSNSDEKNENEYLLKLDEQHKIYNYINNLCEVILSTQHDERFNKNNSAALWLKWQQGIFINGVG